MRKLYLLCLLISAFLSARAQDNAQFTHSSQGLLVQFNNSSQYADTSNRFTYWSFGDGTGTSAGYYYSPAHNYAQPGVYTACLRLYRTAPFTNDTVALTGVICQTITVGLAAAADSCSASFSFQSSGNFLPANYNFFAQASNNNNRLVSAYCWNFGDGSPQFCEQGAPGQPAQSYTSHSFLAPGTFNVCVTANFGNACSNTACHTVTIAPPAPDSCSAQIQVRAFGSSHLTREFNAFPWHNNFKPVTQIQWNFGDGHDTTLQYPNGYGYLAVLHNYATNGTYNVCATITHQRGCVSTVCQTVAVRPDSCTADFGTSYVLGQGSLQPNFSLQASTINTSSQLLQSCWTFGDGSPVQCVPGNAPGYPYGTTVAHAFAGAGTYNVCVTAQFAGGCNAQRCHTLIVVDSTSGPAADSCHALFSSRREGSTGHSRSFLSFPWHNNFRPLTKAVWTFGDGRDTTINYLNGFDGNRVYHNYTGAGPYNVCVTLTYQGGCVSSYCLSVQQQPDTCQTSFQHSFQAGHGSLRPSFSISATSNNQRAPLQTCWTWGDGSAQQCVIYVPNGPNQLINHLFPAAGAYNVCETTTFDGGCSATACRTITLVDSTVVNVPDSCSVHWSASWSNNNAPATFTFNGTAFNSRNRRVVSACWTFGDGTSFCSPGSATQPASLSATHTFAQAGNYSVCLTVTFDSSCVKTYCGIVTVSAATCGGSIAGGQAPTIDGRTYTFQTFPYHSNQQGVTRACVQFGDGRDTCINFAVPPAFVFYLDHKYPQAGTYNACMTLTYQGGCVSTICRPVTVNGIPPADTCHADFSIAPVTATPLARSFTALPWHNLQKRVTRVCWLFGNGRDTCINYPAGYTGNYSYPYAYPAYGTYTVCAEIYYEGGCQSSNCKTITVAPPPPPPAGNCSAAMALLPDTGFHRRVLAIPDSLQRPVNICWSWGDNTSSCVQQPATATAAALTADHHYAAPGNYLVCVRITYANGCVAQRCQNVAIQSSTNCAVSFSDTALNATTFRFEAAGSTDPGDSIVSYRWIFGDGTAATGRSVQHDFVSGGNYQVCVVLRTRSGCEARQYRLVTVNAPVINLLSIHPNPVQATLNANFHALAAGSAVLRIVNASGVVVRTETRGCFAGMNFWSMNLSLLPTGYYTLLVQAPGQYAAQAFFKQ